MIDVVEAQLGRFVLKGDEEDCQLPDKFGCKQFITVTPNLNAIALPPLSPPSLTMIVLSFIPVMEEDGIKTKCLNKEYTRSLITFEIRLTWKTRLSWSVPFTKSFSFEIV
jgi:hypothetical protein